MTGYHNWNPERLPEFPSDIESSIVRDVILASQHEIVPTAAESDLLRYPLLGEGGYGENLYEIFEDSAIDYSYGLRTLKVKVFPRTGWAGPPETRKALKSHEGGAVIFNDALAGIEIDLLHHEKRGILTFILFDTNVETREFHGAGGETLIGPAPSVRLKFIEPSERLIEGVAHFTDKGEPRDYGFVPTTSSQLELLKIVYALIQSPHV